MQVASRVILVRPDGFGFDPQTARTNSFQRTGSDDQVRELAREEFDALIAVLDHLGIGITVLDPVDPQAPNAVFPNNWFSTHADGTLVLYPMCTPSRRTERDPAFVQTLAREGFRVGRVIDLTAQERAERYLEGTGSLVLDRERMVAFAAIGPRTSERALNIWCGAMHGHQVPFLATADGTLTGQPMYHTNVVMSIGERFAVVCLEALPYPVDRDDLWAELDRMDKEIVTITLAQMHAFVGNMLELASLGNDADRAILLSDTAFAALKPDQRMVLERHAQLVPVAVPVIERVGGGSVRCMVAENFLPLNNGRR